MVKNNYKFILGLICGIIISASGVYAATTIIKSKDVSYDKLTSGGKYDNVQDAIDELYEKSGLLSEVWKDPELKGAYPVLDVEGTTKKLIPITLDNDGTVHYANLKTKWYDYADKKWANAILLVDNPSNANYKTGDIINEKDIESYFVWIPRFSYKIWDMGNYDSNSIINSTTLVNKDYSTSILRAFNNAKIIDIKFGNVSTNPRMSENEATLNEYYTHPAFTLGDKDLSGIWVGKFEIGYNQNGNNNGPIENISIWGPDGATVNEENSKRIIVKPNVPSWRNNTIKNFFISSFNYARELESHMMKNTEWGAVAYLSHSKYGIGTEVRINNNLYLLTGYSAVINERKDNFTGETGLTSDITQEYNTSIGVLASTTGNITGIYDMNGGANEYMAAYMDGTIGTSNDKSGFSDDTLLTTTYKNYVDKYKNDNTDFASYNYSNRILGDATGEMGPFFDYCDVDGGSRVHNGWYADISYFVNSTLPWFTRGRLHIDGYGAGQFSFYIGNGNNDVVAGTRLVLSI